MTETDTDLVVLAAARLPLRDTDVERTLTVVGEMALRTDRVEERERRRKPKRKEKKERKLSRGPWELASTSLPRDCRR